MREYLYKAKRKDNGEWVQGNYFKTDNEVYIITNTDGREFFDLWDFTELVIPETICEYTGLKDKNGKKVFHGDIIQVTTIDTNEVRNAVVKLGKFTDINNGDTYLGFYIETADGYTMTATQLEQEPAKDRFEIIGNIYDNPELLEVQDEQAN